MNDKKLKNGIDEVKKIVMTDSEKKHIFDNILNFSPKIQKPIKSPWSFYSFISMSHRTQLVYYIIIPLIIILSGGGAVFASQESLPDSILYPLKVKVVEPIEGALIFSPQAKAKHESSLATRRLVEAETLAKQGKLDIREEQKINKLIENHTQALDKALSKINKSNLNEDKDEIVTNFRAEMNAHARVLDIIKKEEENNKRENDFQKGNGSVPISETARLSADKIKEATKSK